MGMDGARNLVRISSRSFWSSDPDLAPPVRCGEGSNYRRVIACNFCAEKNGGEGTFFPPLFSTRKRVCRGMLWQFICVRVRTDAWLFICLTIFFVHQTNASFFSLSCYPAKTLFFSYKQWGGEERERNLTRTDVCVAQGSIINGNALLFVSN